MRTRYRELYSSIFWLFLFLDILAQDPKGILQSDATKDLNPRSTHALIIGISDYQDKNIEDLHYAHRDAESFYNWLKSAVGTSIPTENIQLLLNQNATNYGITLALYELINTCKKGDQVIIYFSGHGDVQSKTISQPGYLLAYDSPSTIYMGNSLNIRDLQEIITTLTNSNHSQVLLITDACHSGKLAGTSINGAQLASHNLAQLFAGETKILSCQPNEYSLEGKQWGGGRGVFSYFLIDGLKGLADYNEDEIVTLSEMDRYLGEMVPAQTGQLQTPFTMGNRNTYLAQVDGNTFLALQEERKKANVIPGKLETRGLEEQLLSKTDSAAIRLYNQFKNSLAEDRLIEPENACAWYYFQQLETIQALQPLHRILRNNLAVALLDDMQQALNALMNDDPYEVNQWQFNKEKYIQYPEYIRRAIYLLGKEHPANKQLESKLLFFEAFGISHYVYGYPHSNNLDSIKEISRELLKKALLLDTLDPYVYYLMGNSYLATFEEESMKLNYEKAIQLAPNWVLPYLELSWEYLNNYYNFEEAQKYILQGIEKKPEHYQLLEMLAWWHQRYNHLDTIQEICRRLRDLRPDLPNDQLTLAFSYQILLKDHTKAIYHFNRAIALSESSPSLISLHWNIAMSYINSRQFDLGLQTLKKDLEMRNDSLGYELAMATYYVNIQKWDLADRLYTHLIERNRSSAEHHHSLNLASLGMINVKKGELDQADILLDQALELFPTKSLGPEKHFVFAWKGYIAMKRGDPATAEAFFQKALSMKQKIWAYDLNDIGTSIYILYGDFLVQQKRYKEAEDYYMRSININTGYYPGYYSLALFYALMENPKKSLHFLEQSLIRYYPIPQPILEEPLFKKIRRTKRFKEMMQAHFPDSK